MQKALVDMLNQLVTLLGKLGEALPASVKIVAFILTLLVVALQLLGFGAVVERGGPLAAQLLHYVALSFFFGLVLAGFFYFAQVRTEREQREHAAAESAAAREKLKSMETRESFEQRLNNVIRGAHQNSGLSVAWTRRVPRLLLPDPVLRDLQVELSELRDATVREISRFAPFVARPAGAIENFVRTHICLPDTRHAQKGDACGLFIPKLLHVGMDDERERGIIFRTHEGLAGRVFARQKAEAAVREHADDEWSRIVFYDEAPDQNIGYTLTEFQKSLVHRDLRWIMSWPIMVTDGAHECAAGVVSVDGLHTPLTSEQFKTLYIALTTSRIPSLSSKLQAAPMDRLAILLMQEGQHDN